MSRTTAYGGISNLLFNVEEIVKFEEKARRMEDEIGPKVRDGSIKYQEDIVSGIENAPEAFMGMLEGKNHGKVLVKMD